MSLRSVRDGKRRTGRFPLVIFTRSKNVVADYLAKLAARGNESWKDLWTPPREVEKTHLDD